MPAFAGRKEEKRSYSDPFQEQVKRTIKTCSKTICGKNRAIVYIPIGEEKVIKDQAEIVFGSVLRDIWTNG